MTGVHRTRRWPWPSLAAVIALSPGWAVAQRAETVSPPESEIQPVPIKAPFFPTKSEVIEGWINSPGGPDVSAIRRHAWDLWSSLTKESGQILDGQDLPIWETWYSRTEVYDSGGQAALQAHRPRRRSLRAPKQLVHDRPFVESLTEPTNQQTATRILAGVKYDATAALHVWRNRYYAPNHLDAINMDFPPSTPIVDRAIKPFPHGSALLKPTYWIVKQSGQDDTLTLLPYWPWPNQTAPATTDYPPWPMTTTWKTYVAVDPSGKKVGQTVTGRICLWNGKAPRHDHHEDAHHKHHESSQHQPNDPFTYNADVIGLDQFYSFELTEDDIAEIKSKSPKVNVIVQTTTGEQAPAPGDYAILVGMHVTTKEIDDWTWQTFWWTPNRDANPLSSDQPDSVSGVWRNFAMSPAYYMVEPPTSPTPGQDLIAYNPYLELDLGRQGKASNCMSCHRAATWPELPYQFNGAVNPGGGAFADRLKLDFLWSIQGGASANQHASQGGSAAGAP